MFVTETLQKGTLAISKNVFTKIAKIISHR